MNAQEDISIREQNAVASELRRALGYRSIGAEPLPVTPSLALALAETAALAEEVKRLTALVEAQRRPTGVVLAEIAQERERQIGKRYTAEHDDEHAMGEIAAVAAYIAAPTDDERAIVNAPPWAEYIVEKWRNNRRKQLLIAATLLVAEIERLDRASTPARG